MRKKSVVGVDIGGSKMRAVLLDGTRVLKTHEANTPKTLREFKKIFSNLVDNLTPSPIGIAVPGRARGTVFVSATNLHYVRNFDFAGLFPGAKIKIDHDARCFARAEIVTLRQAQGKARKILFLTLGTGVGRAIGKNGKVLKIKKLEYPARWEREYKKIRDSYNDMALAIFLAQKLKSIVKIYRIEKVTIGGGVSTRIGFAAKLQKELGIPVQKSKLGENAVAIGAALQF